MEHESRLSQLYRDQQVLHVYSYGGRSRRAGAQRFAALRADDSRDLVRLGFGS